MTSDVKKCIWSQQSSVIFQGCYKVNIKKQNLFHEPLWTHQSAAFRSDGKSEYSALHLFIIKTDVGDDYSNLRQDIIPSLIGCVFTVGGNLWLCANRKWEFCAGKKGQIQYERQWGSKPACSLVLSNRSIRRSALLRSSLRSSSSWLIRPWEDRKT